MIRKTKKNAVLWDFTLKQWGNTSVTPNILCKGTNLQAIGQYSVGGHILGFYIS